MNIFDAHISGSLSVSSSAEISGDLKVLGVVTGSFKGDGSQIQNIPASGVTGLNLTQIADGEVTASISQTNGLRVNTNSEITGALKVTGSIYLNGNPIGTGKLDESTFNSYTSSNDDRVDAIETTTGSFATTGSNYFKGNQTISGSLLPSGSLLFDIGSETNRWRDIFLAGSTINLGGTKITKDNDGNIQLKDSSNNLKNIVASEFQIGEGANAIVIKRDNSGYFRLAGETQPFIAAQLSGSFTGSGAGLYDIPASGVTGLNLTQIADGSATASISNTNGLRVNTDTEITGALTISGSISLNGVPVGTGKLDESTFNTYTTSINLFSSSIDTTIKDKLNTESVISGSVQVSITGTTGYSTFSSSISNDINSLSSSVTSTINSLSSSISGSVGNISASIATTTLGLGTTITNVSSSISTSISDLSGSVTTINDTQNSRLTSIESSTGSLNSFTSSIDTTIKDKMNADGVLSGSITFDISTVPGFSGLTESVSGSISSSVNQLSGSLTLTVTNLSSSLTNTDESQNARITTIESRYATTGSNSFVGTQNITGSLIISQNLTVLGSSSIVYATSSQMIVEDNVIILNASTPAERFAGIQVYDSGSSGEVTASLLWDGQHNRWIYQNTSDAHYGGAMLIAGPRNTGSLGDEVALTNGRIPKSIGGDHIGDSIITEFSGSIAISGSLIVTGSILSLGTSLVSGSSQISFNGITDKPTLVSGSSQIDHNSTTNYVANQHIDHTTISISAGDGLSGGGTIASNRTISLDTASSTFTTGVKSKLNADGIISGSSQVSFNGISGKPTLVSGSSQIDHNATTNYDSNKHIDHTAVSITAGSGLTGGGDISSTRTINVGAGNGITVNADDIAIDTSSATFTNGVKSKLNTEVVHSGSYLGTATTANLTENSSYLYYTDARVKTKLNAEGVFSGSAQVTGLSNSQLTNSSITIGSTSTSLGGTSTSLAGLTSVTSTAFTGSLQGYATSETLATVTARGASTTNKVTITASGTGGSPLFSLAVSNAASFVHGQETFAANITSGQAVINPIGVAGSTKNAGYIGYKYSGTGGSNDNLLTFGHWGADHLMTMNGQGNVSITGTVTASNLSGTNTGDQTNITGNAGTVTNGVYTNGSYSDPSWITSLAGSKISGTVASATTADQIDSIGFRNTNTSGVAANTLDSNGLTYVTDVDGSSSNLTGNSTDGALYSQIYSSSWQHQIYGDYRTGIMYVRGKNSGTWQSWKRVALSSSTTFSSVTSLTFTHNLGTANVTAQVFDSNGDMFFPSNIRVTSTQVIVTFASSRSGRLVVTG